jgi:predicted AAA+ superfamily ATPase
MARANQMTEIQKIVTSAGWLDKSPNGLPIVDLNEVEPEEELSPTQWKAAVKAKRQEILAERNKSIPAKTTSQTQKDPNQNDVKIIDRSYLNKSFKAKSKAAQSQIDGVVNSKEFRLNTDQERAFRIVANHAVSSNPEQLKMYMGGMGGTGKSQVIKALMHFFKLRN